MRTVLGLNAFHGDAAAVSLDSSGIGMAVEEERFTRVKHWAGMPVHSIRACMAGSDGSWEIPGAIGVARRPKRYLWRKALLVVGHPRSIGRALGRLRNIGAVDQLGAAVAEALSVPEQHLPRIVGVEHHVAHLSSAFHCSPFEEAMCLTVDGFGDFVSTMVAIGRGSGLQILDRVHYPHSLGLFYTALTQYLGFPKYGDEYKVMGLAAYGEPRFAAALRAVAHATRGWRFALDLRYFRHLREGVDMTWEGGEPKLGPVYTERLVELLGPARDPAEPVSDRHKDVAASVQTVYEEHLFRMVRALQEASGLKRLCLAGGCGQNSVANGKLFDETDIEDVYVQAAAGDSGTALGAALYVNHVLERQPRRFVMEHCYWGPEFGVADVRAALSEGIPGSGGRDGTWGDIEVRDMTDDERLVRETAEAISRGEVVGWYQGRTEWGPRALGNRSILADPRRADMRELLNRKIKRRESFRPFAPSILEERVGDWFTHSHPDPFMVKVYPIRSEKRSLIPAVTHVDGTGRLQTVNRRTNERYWLLISAFEAITGIPLLLNTSFNENEPIVNTPAEALACFLRTRMDRLVMGNITVLRQQTGRSSEQADQCRSGSLDRPAAR